MNLSILIYKSSNKLSKPQNNFEFEWRFLNEQSYNVACFNIKLSNNSTIMTYKVIEIEGVGDVYARKLESAGVRTTDDLLDKAATKKGREALAEESGISEKLILKWANHADLFRIKGIAGQFAELLEAAGVDTVKELRHRVPANLHAKLVEVNEVRNLCNRGPAESEIARMVEQAKEIEPRITY